jgi:hypothetical protein
MKVIGRQIRGPEISTFDPTSDSALFTYSQKAYSNDLIRVKKRLLYTREVLYLLTSVNRWYSLD